MLIPKRTKDILALLDQSIAPGDIAQIVGCHISLVYLRRKQYRPEPAKAPAPAVDPELAAMRARAKRVKARQPRGAAPKPRLADRVAHALRDDPVWVPPLRSSPQRKAPRERSRHAKIAASVFESRK